MVRRFGSLLIFVLLLLAACGRDQPTPESQQPLDPKLAAAAGTIRIFAAASLNNAFTEIGKEFEKGNTGVEVEFNFAGTPTLVSQIQQGAPADVIATADEESMKRLADGGLLSDRSRKFAKNSLAIAVRKGNPKQVKALSDLAKPGMVVVLADEAVPLGAYTKRALSAAGVQVTPKSLEQDTEGVLAKVSQGEADAGIVYASDLNAPGGDVAAVSIPKEHNVEAGYPIAVLQSSLERKNAESFIGFVLSVGGQAILKKHGFST